jgi:hypothetical protein
VFTWSAVSGAETYAVYLTPITDSTAIQLIGTSSTNTFTPTSDIPDGDYLWIVTPVSRTCESGPFSDPKSFTIPGTCPVPAPTLLSPDSSIASNPVQFRWSSVPGASLYSLNVGNTATGDIVIQEMVSATTYTATLPSGTYAWQVLGWNSSCDLGPASSSGVFTIP